MRHLLFLAPVMLAGCGTGAKAPPPDQNEVMAPVRAFYRAFGENFTGPADFATEDWNHVNPLGGRARGRDAVLKEVRAVHATFLKDTKDTIVRSDVRFADDDVAVVTAESETSPFALPGEEIATSRRWIRTFVVVRRGGRWLVMHDHNTQIVSEPSERDQGGTP